MERRPNEKEIHSKAGIVDKIRELAKPLGSVEDLRPLLQRCGESKVTLLGEATHGTSEFYKWRSEISKRLIEEEGYSFIAVEGDWPACYEVNRYVKGYSNSGQSARDVLKSFQRWPTWMWSNEEVAELVEWLKDYNQSRSVEKRVGFYGLDVYSLWESMHELDALLTEDLPEASSALKKTLECFEPYGMDSLNYARATVLSGDSCQAAVQRLVNVLKDRPLPPLDDGKDIALQIEQNGDVIRNAEHYYRAMVHSDSGSWNIRDKHMASTLARLVDHYGPQSKGVVWEHNTHIGDARYTDMKSNGMVNIGQLAREEYGDKQVTLVGFSSYHGSVIAGRAWGSPLQRMKVPPARPDSWEDLLHKATNGGDAILLFPAEIDDQDLLLPRGHRAIGVVYQVQYEKFGNYVPTVLPKRYDAVIFLDETQALHPIQDAGDMGKDVPDTFPSAV